MKKSNLVLVIAVMAVFTAGCVNSPPYVVQDDINNDGLIDTVITQYDSDVDMISVVLSLGGESEAFEKEVIRSEIKKGSTIIFDLNQDGKQDILYQTTYFGEPWIVLYGKGDGTFEEKKNMEASDMKFIKNSKSN